MARIYPLFSSSKGNAIYIGTKQRGILVDAGVSYKRLVSALNTCQIEVSAISSVFITHDHSDHVSGLYMLTKHNNIALYGQNLTLRRLIDMQAIFPQTRIFDIAQGVDLDFMRIKPFDTPHDSVQSCGYRIETENGGKCAVCTDLGYVTKTVEEALIGCSTVLLEANYDENMLKSGPYPPYVKARIASQNGHLSNTASAAMAKRLIETGTTQIILGHLSRDNNTPALAQNAVEKALCGFVRNRDYILEVAPVENGGKSFIVNSD